MKDLENVLPYKMYNVCIYFNKTQMPRLTLTYFLFTYSMHLFGITVEFNLALRRVN